MRSRWLPILVTVVALAAAGCSNDDSQAEIASLNEDIASLNAQVKSLDAELADLNAALGSAEEAAAEAVSKAEQQGLLDEIANIRRVARIESAMTYTTILDMESALDLACSNMETDLPDPLMAAFIDWLGETSGEVPDDLVVTIRDAAGNEGQWVFHARFDQMFEPGLFLARPNDSFEVLFGGMAHSAAEVRPVMQAQFPDEDLSAGGCIDVSPFVE